MCMITLALNTLDDRMITVNADHVVTMESLATGTELELTNSKRLLVRETVIEIAILLQDSAKITNYRQH
jgi:uncharacterized protein YlzI (FlbEa/FlbD family)